jgi:pimeloyl-ACP methyl ester carboxylesterase
MPYTEINNTEIYYEVHGQGEKTLFFSHGLLWSTKLFHKQIAHFKHKYRCVVYDHRGQGKSFVVPKGYDMDTITNDAIALIQKLNLPPVHFIGLSMGGFVGMRIAARNPELLLSLTLIETSAEEETFKSKYKLLTTIVTLLGVKMVTGKVMPIMFGDTFLNDVRRNSEREMWINELQKNRKSIVKAVKGVINRKAILPELKNIDLPTLILVGDEDKATPLPKAQTIHQNIKNSNLQIISNAGHSSSIEEPKQVNKMLEAFISKLAV